MKKLIYPGVRCGSFALASEALLALAEVAIPAKQVERRTQQIGTQRCAERDTEAEAYASLPPAERKALPDAVVPPEIAVVQMDGGRIQILDRTTPTAPNAVLVLRAKKKGQHWREDKVGLPASMTNPPCADDLCPTLPTHFIDAQRIPRLAAEIKAKSKSAGREEIEDGSPADASSPASVPPMGCRYEPPELVQRSVVSTKQGVDVFGGLPASAAWRRGFYGAKRRVFLGDGSNANWGVSRQCLAEAWCCLQNQQGRMKYAEYRRAGLPITTSHVESTIKQMNHRVKGSEKFWSEPGSEAILQLRADMLSETEPLDAFWDRRQTQITGERRYNLAVEVQCASYTLLQSSRHTPCAVAARHGIATAHGVCLLL